MLTTEEKRMHIAEPEAPVMVRVEKISKKFGNIQALEDVSFQIRKGEVLGFLGPNGAGKTTAMRILAGYFPPASGRVWIGNWEFLKNPNITKKLIGYLPETVSFYRDMRVSEFLKFAAKLKGIPLKKQREVIDEKMDQCGLWEARRRLIGQLSKGYRQRLGLAQALIGDPEVLLLDEPTSGLDPKQIKEIRILVRELSRDRTLILSTHILPEVSMVCDRVLIFNEGKIIASGTAEELEAGLQKRHEIFVVMGDRHRKDEALECLKAMKGVAEVKVVEENGDRVYFSLIVAKGLELRPQISRLFVERNLPLLELRAGRLSLEDIFLRIVVHENLPEHTS